MTPIPPVIASPTTAPDTIERLRQGLLAASSDAGAAPWLDELLLAGFAPVEPADYVQLLAQARDAQAAGYLVPT
jgi:ABC-type phosphate/phosphonate transport system substrate-binding protein